LIFVHFLFGPFEQAGGSLTRVVFIIEDGSLVLAALFFVSSLTIFHEDRRLTFGLLVLAAVPAEAYIAALDYEKDWRPYYILCLAVIFYGAPIYVAIFRKLTREALIWMPLSILAGSVSIFRAWRHDADTGLLAFLTVGFALPAFLYWRRYRRWSPGVITGVSGFLLWGLVFPVGLFMDKHWPALHINPELWNVPKFFVAFGMILTVLEDKSAYLKSARERERKVSRQLQKFAEITSRLLSGVEVNSLCHEIAQAITETSTFGRATIILSNDLRSLFAAGYSGFNAKAVREMEYRCASVWRLDQLADACRSGEMLGPNSFLLRPTQIGKYGPVPSTIRYEASHYWENGSVVIVPLLTGRGVYVGCLGMDDPRDVTHVTAEEMSQIELLAGDLAVTLDNSALHRQLVRSEKLAAIGQLVAGVAHELNNPLTSIVGYSELLTDEIREGSPRQKIEKMLREAQRMKRIIENLLRFGRQNTLEKKSANLEMLLQDVLTLQEYQIRQHKLDVRVEIESDLPQVALDEDQFKQILFNLINNSIDALQETRKKRITITAARRDDRVVLAFDDNGQGFTDINRVFDPFYTTKAIGKGTGLGLSICYGIVKEHGGEIHAMNLDPHGARILLELPVSGGASLPDTAVVPDKALF
jgi:two-component system, NtrC family, sensor kinase